jgi:NADH:ubiquinone oxidoreductase subunit 6 (subunit J)
MNEKQLQQIFYGGLGALSLVVLGAGLIGAGSEGLAFALFASMTLGGALICIWERSVVRSAFSLMVTFIGVAGLFILLESDFLASAQVLIYVGGILALLLFGVMLSPPDDDERQIKRIGTGLVLIGGGAVFVGMQVASSVVWATNGFPGDGVVNGVGTNAEKIGVGFLGIDQYVVAFELAAVVLTVALVAAVYIARRQPADLKTRPKLESISDGEGN